MLSELLASSFDRAALHSQVYVQNLRECPPKNPDGKPTRSPENFRGPTESFSKTVALHNFPAKREERN